MFGLSSSAAKTNRNVADGRQSFSTTHEAAWYIISVVSICLFVYLSDDNFWKPCHRKFIFAHSVYLQEIRVNSLYKGYRVKVKVTRAKRSNISIGNNPGSIKHRTTRFACMGFSDMTDRMVCPPSLSRDRKWSCVTKCTHSRVSALD